jgi:hypothetical protein
LSRCALPQDVCDAAIVGDTKDKWPETCLIAKRWQGAVNGEKDLLHKVFLERNISFIGGGDSRQAACVACDDRLERMHRSPVSARVIFLQSFFCSEAVSALSAHRTDRAQHRGRPIMVTQATGPIRQSAPVGLWVAGYLFAYLAASMLDLGTTELALRAGGSEGNVFATNAGTYDCIRSLLVTGVGGLVMTALFAFGIKNAARVSGHWLKHPMRSFLIFYLNPWSAGLIDRSPLHALSFAGAFVVLRVLAAVNNMFIVAGSVGPIGALVRTVSRITTPEFGFAFVLGPAFILLAVLLAPFCAKLCQTRLG